MSIWTRRELIALIAQWKAAYLAVSTGKSYTINGRTLVRQDAQLIRSQLAALESDLNALDNPGQGTIRSIPARTVR